MSGRLETKVTPSAATMRRVLGKAITSAEAAAELPDGLDVRLSMANNATEAKAALALSVEAFTAQHGRVLTAAALDEATQANEKAMTLDERTRAMLVSLGLNPDYALCDDADAAKATTKAAKAKAAN